MTTHTILGFVLSQSAKIGRNSKTKRLILSLPLVSIVIAAGCSQQSQAKDLQCDIEATCSALYFGAEFANGTAVPNCGIHVTPNIPTSFVKSFKLENGKGNFKVRVKAEWVFDDGKSRQGSKSVKYSVSEKNGVRKLKGYGAAFGANFDSPEITKSSMPGKMTVVQCQLLD